MNQQIVYKDEFAVIGKMGQGDANEPGTWILPLWNQANEQFSQIKDLALQDENGNLCGMWGAMNDVEEQNKRWNETGKYMAGCEVSVDAVAPEGWSKWIIPAQTYLVIPCTMDTYGKIFGEMTSNKEIQIVGTVHERYHEPGNSNKLELYFPIASGMLFCQSCGMPLTNDSEIGTNADGSKNQDYCKYCFDKGEFLQESTMEEMIEFCIPFVSNNNPHPNEEEARKAMNEYFPTLKRWKQG